MQPTILSARHWVVKCTYQTEINSWNIHVLINDCKKKKIVEKSIWESIFRLSWDVVCIQGITVRQYRVLQSDSTEYYSQTVQGITVRQYRVLQSDSTGYYSQTLTHCTDVSKIHQLRAPWDKLVIAAKMLLSFHRNIFKIHWFNENTSI